MIYADDPRRLIQNADRWHPFVIEVNREPVDFHWDRLTEILTVHFDPFEAQFNPGCPLCYAPITRLRLFDVNQYTIDTRPFAWQPEARRFDVWKITVPTRAVEFSPCPHVIAPYTADWYRRYSWPSLFTDPWPAPRERWGQPLYKERQPDEWLQL